MSDLRHTMDPMSTPEIHDGWTVVVPVKPAALGKTRLTAQQVSRRGGDLMCMAKGKRVYIAGHAVLYMRGAVEV